jgi:Cof subfamily protein (haloacid dehalogenase superfamily)
MFPFKLVAVDLDDTLLGPDKRMSDANGKAIASLIELGAAVVLASGRVLRNMISAYRELGLTGPLVACNGAWVGDPITRVAIREFTVADSIACELFHLGEIEGCRPFFHDLDGLFVRRKDEWSELYERRSSEVATVVVDYAQLVDRKPHKLTWYGPPERIAQLKERLTHQYRGVLSLFSTEKENIEFVPHGVDKSTAIAAIAESLDIKASEVLAFGDGLNDVGMLSWAGLGVAMDHAHPEAIASAKLVPAKGKRETALARAVDLVLAR